jgi:hypothetical protein
MPHAPDNKLREKLADERRNVRALKQENMKLHRRIAALEAKLLSLENRRVARSEVAPVSTLTDQELEDIIKRNRR